MSLEVLPLPAHVAGEFESTTSSFNFKTIGASPSTTFSIDKTSGYVFVNQTDDATAVNSGSLQVAGGAAVSKQLWVGSDANVAGSLTVTGNVSITGVISTTGENSVTLSNTTDSTSTGTGSVIVLGGMGIAKSIVVGGYGKFVNTTDSTSTSTGSVIISGGLGLAGSAYLGGILHIVNTTTSTSTTSGSFVTAGGLGVAQDFFLGGTQQIVNVTDSSDPFTGSLVTAGGIGVQKNMNVGGDSVFTGTVTVNGTSLFSNTLDSTSASTGAVVFSGGIGISQSLFVGSTIDSTSSSTGGIVVSGGLAVAKNSFFGGDLTLAGTNPLLTFNNSGLSAPTFSSESAGTRIILNSNLSSNSVDYSIGVNSNAMWSAIPKNTALYSFSWYGGTTAIMSLNGLGNLTVNGTADTTSSSSGAFVVAGGAGFAKSVSIGTSLFVQSGSWTSSTGNDVYLNANDDSVFLRNTTGSNSGEFESNLTDFNFRTVDTVPFVTVNINKETGYLSVYQTDTATANNTGALQVYGGGSVTKDFWVGGNTSVVGNLTVSGSISTTGNSPVTFSNTTNSTSPSTGGVVLYGGLGIAKNVFIAGITDITNTTASTSTTDGALVVAGGIGIGGNSTFGGIISIVNTTDSTSSGISPPSFITESVGTRIILSSALDTSSVDYSIGIDTNSMWSAIPQNNATFAFDWYAGETVAMALNGLGNLTVNGTADTTSISSGALVVAGGAGFAKSVSIGTSLFVQSGSWTSSTGNDVYINANDDSVFLRNTTGSNSGEFESNLTDFNFRTVDTVPFVTVNINKETGYLSVYQTDTATANNTGALQVYGGGSVTKDFWVGGNTTVVGNLTVSGSISTTGSSPVTFSNTTNSTSPSTGGVVLYGGLGIAKNVFIAGITDITNTTASTSTTDGALVVAGGIGIGGNSTFVNLKVI
ncbi:hypothetical protein HDU81_007914 [Chytriomyces hyalinus]|nr:hypothetical protein HDU81_007914 [Chytriomyces hyalinus]